jgi:hypothetical protein
LRVERDVQEVEVKRHPHLQQACMTWIPDCWVPIERVREVERSGSDRGK